MPLKEKLLDDFKASMKNKDKVRKNVVTMIRAAIKQREIDDKIELSDDDIISIIAKQVKQRKDSIDDFKRGNREDLVEACSKEIDVLKEYLPLQLSKEELLKIIEEAIEATGATSNKEMGKVMAKIMPQVKGKADGKEINKIVMKLLQ